MSHWIILPIVLPALLAAFQVMFLRQHLVLGRTFSLLGTGAFVLIGFGLTLRAATSTITVYQLGDWAAPFGIVLVADRLSTLMVLLLGILALAVLLYAIGSNWDRAGRHFHALFQFQLMGLAGAFLTGDAFNLFVFFEILLIASYGLIIHSGGGFRLRAGLQYVVYNLLGSTLFLFALGTIYSITGTLNMADLAVRVAELPAGDTALIRAGAVLLLLVFCVKAAVLPLHFWLPISYAAAPGPVAALFAIMTKVGAYAIIRMYTLVFPPSLPSMQGLFATWFMPAALLTLAIGMIGVLGAQRLERLVAFSVIGSMGTLLVAIALFTPDGTSAALFYAAHSTFTAAALFLIVDLVARSREGGGRIVEAPPMPLNGLLAGGFFVGGIALVGLPPLSGFVGKLLVLDAARGRADQATIWAVILATSLLATIGFARAGSTVFWKTHAVPAGPVVARRPTVLSLVATGLPLLALSGLTIFAGPAMSYFQNTAAQLHQPQPYIDAVLGANRGRALEGDAAASTDAEPAPAAEEDGH